MASTNGTTVHVDIDALQALRDAVYARYGRIHGVLGAEASKALREHAARLKGSGGADASGAGARDV